MIPFVPAPEPPYFDEKVRQPGNEWLETHHNPDRPRDYWSACLSDLKNAFRSLCAYSAMFEPVGTVDHYLSCINHPQHVYEWGNYRFASGWINSTKRDADEKILDPFEIQNDWFEVLLPSLQLVLTENIPPQVRSRAAFTLNRLKLMDGHKVIEQRKHWYEMYANGLLPLEGLTVVAPLVAKAVRKINQLPAG